MCGETLGSISRRASLLPHNKRLYRQPNCIERVFGRLKINGGRRYLPFLFVPVFLVVPGASRVSPCASFTDSTLVTEVANTTKPIVIKFEAKWCQPCKAMTPIVQEVEKEFAGKIDF
jgi:hypothetical protein